jgi:signal recognition particle subunit SRP68
MKGALLFEMQDWTSAIEQYRKAQTIYEKLASALTEDDRVIYRQRVDDITPNIRYCSYNIGDESAINDLKQLRFTATGEDQLSSNLDALILQTREKQASTLSEVSWRGRTVPVRHEKVRVFLLNANERSAEVGKASDDEQKMQVYDTLLMEARDALQVLREELKADPVFKAKGAVDGQVNSLNFLHSYVTYLRQMMTVERNILLLDEMKQNLPQPDGTPNPLADGKKPTKPQDLVRLYEIIIQSLGEIIQLPGVEDDMKFVQDLQAQVQAYKAFRCYYIALVFSTARKWPEAMALYQRVLQYIKEANKEGKLDKNLKIKMQELQQNVNGLQQSAHALSILGTHGSTDLLEKKSINNKALVDRLEEYYEDAQLRSKNANITPFPPVFQPIPCKPLFFDLALNHVELPDLEDRLEQRKAGGLTGLVKGWLWGGGAKK